MKKLLQINVTANWGSTGRIAEGIGLEAIRRGWESTIAYGRGNPCSRSHTLRIGSDMDMRLHGAATRLLDRHGLASAKATRRFIDQARELKPDLVHLHNIHGYYLNYPLLFSWLKQWGGPVVWTLHDCWPITGHCAHYMGIGCRRWMEECHHCPLRHAYPASMAVDGSRRNHRCKKESFLGLPNLHIAACSRWLADDLRRSFLGVYPIHVMHNGIDLDTFRPSVEEKTPRSIIGVASVWDSSKGLEEFHRLRQLLPPPYSITLVGLSAKQIRALPEGITGMERTDSVARLAELYSRSAVFVNPTFEDNYPTTNLEATACGTPVITYRTGGSPESVTPLTGSVVERGDIRAMAAEIMRVCEGSPYSAADCRSLAMEQFDQHRQLAAYIDLYDSII